MAETGETNPKILKNTKIIVYVEEAIEDLIVVSFTFGGKLYQGVLLDASKKSVPYGVTPSWLVDNSEKKAEPENTTEGASDRLYAVSQRHTYVQGVENESPNNQSTAARRPFKTFKDRNVRTMRLRPRQVLCSKCRSICNEKSENVQIQNSSVSKDSAPPQIPLMTADKKEKYRLKPRTESIMPRATSQSASPTSNSHIPAAPIGGHLIPTSGGGPSRMMLRKRRSEDDLEREEVEKRLKKTDNPVDAQNSLGGKSQIPKTSPVIKISFGPQGQGTVLKISTRSHDSKENDVVAKDESDPEIKVNDDPNEETVETHEKVMSSCEQLQQLQVARDASAKAAKKALKKAKKEAHRKTTTVVTPSSPFHYHKSRHHKHKFKHKRRHRDDPLVDETSRNEAEDNIAESGTASTLNIPLVDSHEVASNDHLFDEAWNSHSTSEDSNKSDSSSYNEIKEKCLRQKLSINLKRVNAKAYMRCSPSVTCNEDGNSSGGSHNSDFNCNSDPDVPVFPGNGDELKEVESHQMEKVKPLMMRISTHNVESCVIASGRIMAIGDIVWGKIHGFPWWPGKVLSITISQRDNGILITQQAHVAWFGSSTSSYMPCSQLVPFLECFKMRYNKKKRGPYKEAIKQATLAAQQVLREMQVVSPQA